MMIEIRYSLSNEKFACSIYRGMAVIDRWWVGPDREDGERSIVESMKAIEYWVNQTLLEEG